MKTLINALLLCAFLVPLSLNAALIEADYLSGGDNLLLQDTDTGLEWLDVTESAGFSYNDIIGGAGGFIAAGFRYANQSEVETLYSNAGITAFNTASLALRAPVKSLVDAIGCTGCSAATDWYSALHLGTSGTVSTLVASFVQYKNPGFGPAAVGLAYPAFYGTNSAAPGASEAESWRGSYLVRTTGGATGSVPAPGVVFLLALGALAIVGNKLRS